ncbi:hypothetical protein BDV32DRAFT_121337 [Aspergillus pseudonomiae]|nr:hypothetical protein BDV32DRAFT_121337 [Aspergillus pseudonomiae]
MVNCTVLLYWDPEQYLNHPYRLAMYAAAGGTVKGSANISMTSSGVSSPNYERRRTHPENSH